MSRVKRAVARNAKRKKLLKLARGYRGRSKNNLRLARERVEKGLQYDYRDRRQRKRSFRRLWIQRINAGAREHGISYSKFMSGLDKAGIEVDRKILADLAAREPETFKSLVDQAQEALAEAA